MTQPAALYLADVIANDPCSKAHHDAAAAELRHLHGMVERLSATCEALKDALASSCDEERQQMWEAGPGGGCSRALTAEFQRDALLEALERSRAQWIHSVNAEQCLAAIAKAQQ